VSALSAASGSRVDHAWNIAKRASLIAHMLSLTCRLGDCEGLMRCIEQRIQSTSKASDAAKKQRADVEAKQEELKKSLKVR
jgi:hypothetical protein